jgi:hypothetical protein
MPALSNNRSAISLRTRLLVAFVVGAGAAVFCWFMLARGRPWMQASDFTYPWIGARAILDRADPYVVVHHVPTPWGPFMLYPAPAFLVALPVAWLPAQLAGSVFVGVSTGLLAFVLIPFGGWRLLLLLSAPTIQAATCAQWSPLLTACALWMPALGILAAKPTIGLPLFAMQPRPRVALRYAVLGGSLLVALSFALVPHWLTGWWAATHGPGMIGQYASPITSPFGWILALAALRWRRPEGRLLLAMACVPQKLMFYDQLPLMLIPGTWRELQVAVFLSLVAYAIGLQFPWAIGDPGAVTARLTPLVVVGLYWPALVLVLMRPNRAPPI